MTMERGKRTKGMLLAIVMESNAIHQRPRFQCSSLTLIV